MKFFICTRDVRVMQLSVGYFRSWLRCVSGRCGLILDVD